MNKPRTRDYETRASYRRAYREYITERHEAGTSAPHHESEYPVVISCPICGGPSTIDTTSRADDPTWSCMTSLAPGHHVYVDGNEYVATLPGDDIERRRRR